MEADASSILHSWQRQLFHVSESPCIERPQKGYRARKGGSCRANDQVSFGHDHGSIPAIFRGKSKLNLCSKQAPLIYFQMDGDCDLYCQKFLADLLDEKVTFHQLNNILDSPMKKLHF